jgi:hypothetical protein
MIFELDESFEIRKSLIDLTSATSDSNTNDNYNYTNNPPKQTSPPSRLTAAGIIYLILLRSIYLFYRYQYNIFIILSSFVVPSYSIFIYDLYSSLYVKFISTIFILIDAYSYLFNISQGKLLQTLDNYTPDRRVSFNARFLHIYDAYIIMWAIVYVLVNFYIFFPAPYVVPAYIVSFSISFSIIYSY